MEEDVVGTERVLHHGSYVACSRCGAVVDTRSAALVPGAALDDVSEFQYLCAGCQQALADGEQDLPSDAM
jgi:RNA polymerase-binding transcription factor DksA